MAIEIITGFDQKEYELLDKVRGKVANEAARLAIKWPARGLLTFQIDTGETYQYLGNPPSNVIADWTLFTAQGIQGPAGVDGIDGADGDKYATVSTDSFAIPETHPTTINITVALNLAYTAGQPIIIVADTLNFFNAIVLSYDSGTGTLSVESASHTGTGTFANWQVNLAGTQGIKGNALIHTEADIVLDEAKVISVEAGTWTPVVPYSASVFNDTRSNLTQPAPLNGSMIGHSISYDGTNWNDNGVWRGSTGIQGIQGIDGIQGIQGIPGVDGADGTDGINGINGINGIDGVDGADGNNLQEYFTPSINPDFVQIGNGIYDAPHTIHTYINTNKVTEFLFLDTVINLKGLREVILHFNLNGIGDILVKTLANDTNRFFGSFLSETSLNFKVSDYIVKNSGTGVFRFIPHPDGVDVGWKVTGGLFPEIGNTPALVARVSAAGTMTIQNSDGAVWTLIKEGTGSYRIRRDGTVMSEFNSFPMFSAHSPVGSGLGINIYITNGYIGTRRMDTGVLYDSGFGIILYL